MPTDVIAEPVAETTETFADFHAKFGEPAAAESAVKVNSHGTEETSAPASDKPAEAEHANGSDPSQKQDKVEKRKQQIQRDIDAAVARREAAKREADQEESRLRTLKTDPRTTSAASAAATTFDGTDSEDAEPKQEAFDDYQQWMDARSAWIGRKEFRKLEHQKTEKAQREAQNRAQEESQRNYKTAVSDFEERGNEFAAEHDDYPALVTEFKNQKVSNETEAFLLWGCDGTEGPDILYRLMKEPEKLKEIDKLASPIARFSALYAFKYESRIAELEAQLEAKGQAPAKPKVTKAPPTGTHLRAGGAATPNTVDNAPNFSSFKKAFDEKNGLRK